jgi:hypothetical protein
MLESANIGEPFPYSNCMNNHVPGQTKECNCHSMPSSPQWRARGEELGFCGTDSLTKTTLVQDQTKGDQTRPESMDLHAS